MIDILRSWWWSHFGSMFLVWQKKQASSSPARRGPFPQQSLVVVELGSVVFLTAEHENFIGPGGTSHGSPWTLKDPTFIFLFSFWSIKSHCLVFFPQSQIIAKQNGMMQRMTKRLICMKIWEHLPDPEGSKFKGLREYKD